MTDVAPMDLGSLLAGVKNLLANQNAGLDTAATEPNLKPGNAMETCAAYPAPTISERTLPFNTHSFTPVRHPSVRGLKHQYMTESLGHPATPPRMSLKAALLMGPSFDSIDISKPPATPERVSSKHGRFATKESRRLLFEPDTDADMTPTQEQHAGGNDQASESNDQASASVLFTQMRELISILINASSDSHSGRLTAANTIKSYCRRSAGRLFFVKYPDAMMQICNLLCDPAVGTGVALIVMNVAFDEATSQSVFTGSNIADKLLRSSVNSDLGEGHAAATLGALLNLTMHSDALKTRVARNTDTFTILELCLQQGSSSLTQWRAAALLATLTNDGKGIENTARYWMWQPEAEAQKTMNAAERATRLSSSKVVAMLLRIVRTSKYPTVVHAASDALTNLSMGIETHAQYHNWEKVESWLSTLRYTGENALPVGSASVVTNLIKAVLHAKKRVMGGNPNSYIVSL